MRLFPFSVATVMTDVFQKNEINLLRKFAKIVRIFDKIDDLKSQGVIYEPQSFGNLILELLKND
jgi:hypothetical protein